MPELPEVETILRGLQKKLAGEVIEQVFSSPARVFQSPGFDPRKRLAGKVFAGISRRGKYLIFTISDIKMVIHLGMTGQLLLKQETLPVNPDCEGQDPHIHFRIHCGSGKLLLYRDPRKFGKILFFTGNEELLSYFKRLGTEPLSDEFTYDCFSRLLQGRKGKIKPFLMNQAFICGIGNIYADEALFSSGIHPECPVSSISADGRKRLYEAIPSVLRKGIESGGTTFRDYRNSEGDQGSFQEKLYVYGREGQPCLLCGHLVERIQVGGRSSHFCPSCQKFSLDCS